jgi:hypothetical protein
LSEGGQDLPGDSNSLDDMKMEMPGFPIREAPVSRKPDDFISESAT